MHRGMCFKPVLFVVKGVTMEFHGMMRSMMPYRAPRMGDRTPCMHGGSSMMGELVPVPRENFVRMFHLIMGIFLMQGPFHLLLRLCQAHAAIGGFTDPR